MNALLDIETNGTRLQLHLGTNLAAHSYYSERQQLWGELCDTIRHIVKTHLRKELKADDPHHPTHS